MLTEKEKQFINYWEKNRDAQSAVSSKLLRGFPMALLFSLPIILFIVVVKIFLPEWYYKISQTSPGMFFTIIIAVLIIAVFYSIFRMHFKWEHNEEVYQRLISKQNKKEQ